MTNAPKGIGVLQDAFEESSTKNLEMRPEVNVKVSDSKWYAPLRHPKRNHHPKFGIPTSNNIRDMLWTQ